MGYGDGSGFIPALGSGGGGGGSVTWTDTQIGYGIDGSDVISNSDFIYDPDLGFKVGFNGDNYFFIDKVNSVVSLGDNPYTHTGQQLIIDFKSGVSSLGDLYGHGNSTFLEVADGSELIELNTVNATIGTADNFAVDVTGQFSLGQLDGIPVISTSLGVYNTIANSLTGDVAISGVGDLTALGYSTEGVFSGHFGGDGSLAIILADKIDETPEILSIVVNSDGTKNMIMTQTPTSWSVIGIGGTGISIDDTTGRVNFKKIPTYANDAAAISAGLTGGDAYYTTTAGSTYLKMVPY